MDISGGGLDCRRCGRCGCALSVNYHDEYDEYDDGAYDLDHGGVEHDHDRRSGDDKFYDDDHRAASHDHHDRSRANDHHDGAGGRVEFGAGDGHDVTIWKGELRRRRQRGRRLSKLE